MFPLRKKNHVIPFATPDKMRQNKINRKSDDLIPGRISGRKQRG